MRQSFSLSPQDLFLSQFANFANPISDFNAYFNSQTILYKQCLNALKLQREQQLQQHLQHIYLSQQAHKPSVLNFPNKQLQPTLKQESFIDYHSLPLKVKKPEAWTPQTEDSESKMDTRVKQEENDKTPVTDHLTAQISNIVSFILTSFGRASQEEMNLQRSKYSSNETLLILFDTLMEKYQSAAKCREDMVRFILRKTMTSLRDNVRKRENLNCKGALLVLCKKYYNLKTNELIKEEINVENEEDVLNFLLPYKKNSRNRTANSCFINEIFASPAFYEDYQEYLTKFDDILKTDNQKKLKKFIEFLAKCVKENSMHKIKKYKRLPWVQTWLETTKVIAYELLNTNVSHNSNSQVATPALKKQKTSK